MNREFKIELSIYIMGAFIALVGMLFLMARSDTVLQFRYYNEPAEQAVLYQEAKTASWHVPSYLLLTGPDHQSLQHLLQTRLELMGKDVVVQPIESIETEADLSGFSSVVIATEQIDLLKGPDIIAQFVKEGGSVFFAIRPAPGPTLSTLYQSIGLVEMGNFVETSGIELAHPLFGEVGYTSFPSENILNSSLSVRLSRDVELVASSSSGVPLLWKALYGNGVFIVFNGTMFMSAEEQALFIKGIQLASEQLIMPIVNARVTEISGFPFLVPDGRSISSSLVDRDYYRMVVWPELQRIESKYDLNYTGAYVSPEGPLFSEGEQSVTFEDLQLYGRELLRMGGEIALQESFVKTADLSVLSLYHKAAIQQIQETFPDYPVRSMVLSSSKRNTGGMDDVSTMLEPHDPYIKEFEGTVVLPKTIEGFNPDNEAKWRLINEVAASGYYSHELHPSRFLEEGNPAEQLVAFADFQQSVASQIPWIRSRTLSKAGEEAFAYLNSEIYEEHEGDKITFYATVMKEKTQTYYYFSTSRSIVKTENCTVEKVGKGLYVVAADHLKFSIVLGGLE